MTNNNFTLIQIFQILKFNLNNMTDIEIIDLTPENIAEYGLCGYKDVKKHLELRRKIDWVKEYYPMGLRIKAIISKKGGYQGMLEYIPGKYAHRPVDADGYMFIHCLFVGFKNEFKGKGFASSLIDECLKDAKYSKGLTIIRSAQCPYSVKNVDAILDMAKKLKIEANLIEIMDSESAQQTPCAFGTFCIIHNNEVISHHPISNTRFENIMAKR